MAELTVLTLQLQKVSNMKKNIRDLLVNTLILFLVYPVVLVAQTVQPVGTRGGGTTFDSGSSISACDASAVVYSNASKVAACLSAELGYVASTNILTVGTTTGRVALGTSTTYIDQTSNNIEIRTPGTIRLNAGGVAGAGGYLDLNYGSGYTYLVGYGGFHAFELNYGDRSASAMNSSFRFTTNPGNTSAGFGAGLTIRGQSSTTASQDMARISGVWTTATHASRSAAMVFDVVNNAAALAEVGRFHAVGGLKISTGTKPTCDSTYRGTLYYVAGGAGVLDTYEVCRKDAANVYAWVTIF